MSRLVVISNRVPASASAAGAGGLAVALKAALEECGGLWFGWSGEVREDARSGAATRSEDGFSLASIDLTAREFADYYEQFANRSLWPLFHGRLDLSSFDHDSCKTYLSVNRRFAETLAPMLRPGDTIWVHDYHLIPLGLELRRLGVRLPIGFFLHIPFPSAQILEALPWVRETVEQLCAYDLVGLQTERDLLNFRDAVTRTLGGYADAKGVIEIDGKRTRAAAFPIGIDYQSFSALASSSPSRRRVGWLGRRFGECRLMIGVDRLDYTKGLAERFEAFARLLDEEPDLSGRVSFLQIAAPSREGIAEYQAMQTSLETLVGHINGRLGTVDWTPVRYINRCFSHEQLAALYRFCSVGIVTPLCDGMNLVAKEYVAAQDPENPGALVLSRFAGAAETMTDALLVNPHDREETAAAIGRALRMPLPERRARWEKMLRGVRDYDVHVWRRDFLDSLALTRKRDGGSFGPRAA